MMEELADLRDRIEDIGLTYRQDTGAGGGPSRTSEEERMLIAQDRYAVLKPAYEYKRREVERIERALRILTAEQQLILQKFYIDRPEGHIEALCNELNIERSQVYERHGVAIRAFTKALYAMVDG